MRGLLYCFLFAGSLLLGRVNGFSMNIPQKAIHAPENNNGLKVATTSAADNQKDGAIDISTINFSRRDIFQSSSCAIALSTLLLMTPTAANASGGATAGGAYLRSAKQRYNDRVNDGAKAYISLGKSLLKDSDLGPSKIFLTDEDQWKDFASAGYLLANAFRSSSSTSPDALPSVKKWKAFSSKVESFEKAVKKKSLSTAQKEYEAGLELLDPYLEAISLPSVLEIGGAK